MLSSLGVGTPQYRHLNEAGPTARDHSLKAIALGDGKFLMAEVYYANYYAKKAFDRNLYISILEEVLKKPANETPELTLLNTVAHTKAKKMLKNVDEYFLGEQE